MWLAVILWAFAGSFVRAEYVDVTQLTKAENIAKCSALQDPWIKYCVPYVSAQEFRAWTHADKVGADRVCQNQDGSGTNTDKTPSAVLCESKEAFEERTGEPVFKANGNANQNNKGMFRCATNPWACTDDALDNLHVAIGNALFKLCNASYLYDIRTSDEANMGYIWSKGQSCWAPRKGNPVFSAATASEINHAKNTAANICPTYTCASYGDPHYRGFEYQTFDFQGRGDFTLFETSFLRIDTRVKVYYDKNKKTWDTVSGNHAFVMQGPLTCDHKIEIFNAYETGKDVGMIMVDGVEVAYADFNKHLDDLDCKTMCTRVSLEISEADDHQVTVQFSNGIVMRNTNWMDMQNIYVTLPVTELVTLTNEPSEALCTARYKSWPTCRDCGEGSKFSRYPKGDGTWGTCEEQDEEACPDFDPDPDPIGDCPEPLRRKSERDCANCQDFIADWDENMCIMGEFHADCVFDICAGVTKQWKIENPSSYAYTKGQGICVDAEGNGLVDQEAPNSATTLEDCQAACDADLGCTSFQFVSPDCHLIHAAGPQASGDEGATCGVKIVPPQGEAARDVADIATYFCNSIKDALKTMPCDSADPVAPPTYVPTEHPIPSQAPTLDPTAIPTPQPSSPEPTNVPTADPTQSPTGECWKYHHMFENGINGGYQDQYLNVGEGRSCRGGIPENLWWDGWTEDERKKKNANGMMGYVTDDKEEYPGLGPLCEQETSQGNIRSNPYLTCLQVTTINLCQKRCNRDQRCKGFEYRKDDPKFQCILIDDIEVIPLGTAECEDANNCEAQCYSKDTAWDDPAVDPAGAKLASNVLHGNMIDWQKEGRNVCIPMFDASDLSQEMLSCYCGTEPQDHAQSKEKSGKGPTRQFDFAMNKIASNLYNSKQTQKQTNTRSKYFEDKTAKRNVKYARLCIKTVPRKYEKVYLEKVVAETEAIQRALANRMFHLCQNWCLFDVEQPDKKFWLWHPVKLCYQEQSLNKKSYCFREHVKKNTVEMQYMKRRASEFCGKTVQPTSSPTTHHSKEDVKWFVGKKSGAPCNKICEWMAGENYRCAEEEFSALTNDKLGISPSYVAKVFKKATGKECKRVVKGLPKYGGPLFSPDTSTCVLRHKRSKPHICKGRTYSSYRRVCPCVKTD